VVSQQNADIADTMQVRHVAMPAIFWPLMVYNFGCVIAATCCLIFGVSFRSEAIPWKHR